ncbi:uncharacterized protein BDZ99DRAFT_180651 [Mytilinidion resinicola]|uniref:Apple domain-containing protein n=1 Tax=Mytilinidion resinicola TaxID=574789 RepID=A0A6A6Z1J7_9PEZI|nr:uncharacterized protein BDZ99DRAFT_180651 [Mytilinidion resinicola]KAF2814599.1 hypothetical protein BDZ99DRAFT_180651 [Mytilinidion resinicola]
MDTRTLQQPQDPLFNLNFTQCITACASNSTCTDLSYTSGGTCYLKQGVAGTNPAYEAGICDALVSVRPVITSTTISSSPTPGSSTLASPSPSASAGCYGYANGTTATINGVTFLVQTYTVNSNNMLAGPLYNLNFTQCMTTCATTQGCTDTAYTSGGTCFLNQGVAGTNPAY